jgi:hypothetical protein
VNTPYGMVVESDYDRFVDPDLELAHCHKPKCPGYDRGFLFDSETDLCPFCGEESWS